MSKKIDAALKDLIKALEKHAEAVGGSRISLKKSERASARVQETATTYAQVVYEKSGLESPLSLVSLNGLDAATLSSLAAERDKLSSKKKK
ncbi:hypothetical protein [Lacisediminihabitans changchengi]|uniref:Uncharacterized protein n=1 Tax=Lacisediminihabitans changchengi TaxID=2787634 RepID=A0A934SKQ5_9MICO|nr:hypothetical protein [Lacisediminihabitans changchengi]MBK4347154.1 hypothetical protein [Lacisediminihabitans changchengi]